MKRGFDNDAYVTLQAERIRQRISEFGGKLYLEFGGKLADDHHASRVLPGFAPDVKLRMLLTLKEEAEVVVVVNAADIASGKVRSDLGISYDEDALRLVRFFSSLGLPVAGVVLTRYASQPAADAFRRRLDALEIPCALTYSIEGYPHDVDAIVSETGFGANEFLPTSRPLVVVTAPGPGSGKLATCLSQLYHEHARGIQAGYAKYETFPVWNLPLVHPVNVAYEAATADLGDSNVIDPFHLDAYGVSTVNYNRDVESFPVVRALMERILNQCPYQSPTDMGVNMVASGIVDDEVCRQAARKEIIRRYFAAACTVKRTGAGQAAFDRLKLLVKQVGVEPDTYPLRLAALERAEQTCAPAGALELPNGTIVTGKTSDLIGAASSTLLNALKAVARAGDVEVLAPEVIEPICHLKTHCLGAHNPRLHTDETLIALAQSSVTDPVAAQVFASLESLRDCDAFFSVMLSDADKDTLRKLGIRVSCEPVSDYQI